LQRARIVAIVVRMPNIGRVVIAGGSGFLGHSLARFLHDDGGDIVILSRTAPRSTPFARHIAWNGRSVGAWKAALDGALAIINLAGRSVDCPKTPDNRDLILRSRVEPTLALGRACREVASPPAVWVQMSTAHIYGDPPEVVCSEDSPFGMGVAPFVGRAWEEAFQSSVLPQQRQVILRTGFVIG
jgi:NAD dependent epimerase/dehydratase family enzyme